MTSLTTCGLIVAVGGVDVVLSKTVASSSCAFVLSLSLVGLCSEDVINDDETEVVLAEAGGLTTVPFSASLVAFPVFAEAADSVVVAKETALLNSVA